MLFFLSVSGEYINRVGVGCKFFLGGCGKKKKNARHKPALKSIKKKALCYNQP